MAETENLAKNEVLTFSDLNKRGWTRSMVCRFLGSTDTFTQNPHLNTGRPMRLIKSARVREFELGLDFIVCRKLS